LANDPAPEPVTVRRFVLAMCVLPWITSPLSGQATAFHAPPQGMASVDTFIETAQRDRDIPSISVSVAQHGKIIYEKAYGLADREKHLPAAPNTPYYVASVTKALTGISLMILQANHKIDLDRPANDYLRSARLHSPMWDVSQATVRRVANHTAGLTTYDHKCIVGDARCHASTEVAIERYGLVFWPPGDHFDYSNLGYGVLGQIISNVSGESFPEFLRREIFEPLKMNDCYLPVTGDLRIGSAVNYGDRSAKPSPLHVSDTPAASSARCSAHDLAVFGSFVLGTPVQGQKKILADNSLRRLLYSDEASAGEHYSFGWDRNDAQDYKGVFAQGGTEDSFAVLQLIPEAGLSVAVISNTGTTFPFEIVDRIVGTLLPPKSSPRAMPKDTGKDGEPAPELAGHWTGAIQTWTGRVPLSISISSANSVQAAVGDNAAALTVCEKPSMTHSRIDCMTHGDLGTSDAPSPPYQIELELYLHGETLVGAATTSGGFQLPYWAELKKANR